MANEKKAAAQEAILDAIIGYAPRAGNAEAIRNLAEAYSLVRTGEPGKERRAAAI
ncbi:hypothetical protein ACWIE7_11000 [Dietzia sp. NPDC055343]